MQRIADKHELVSQNAPNVKRHAELDHRAQAVRELMSIPRGSPLLYCPCGLNCLEGLNELFIKQQIRRFAINNYYKIRNTMEQTVYFCVQKRTLPIVDLKIVDNFQNEIMCMHRSKPQRCFCFSRRTPDMKISSPPCTLIGWVDKSFYLKNAVRETVFRIRKCRKIWCILDLNNHEVGTISFNQDCSEMSVKFPVNTDVYIKSIIVAATLLIVSKYFKGVHKPPDAVYKHEHLSDTMDNIADKP